jgi:hypothetical protein
MLPWTKSNTARSTLGRSGSIKNAFRRSVAALTHDADREVVALGNGLDPISTLATTRRGFVQLPA